MTDMLSEILVPRSCLWSKRHVPRSTCRLTINVRESVPPMLPHFGGDENVVWSTWRFTGSYK